MRLIFVMAIVFVSLVPHFAFAKEPFEIKGIRLGITEAELNSRLAGIPCKANEDQHSGRFCIVDPSSRSEFKSFGGSPPNIYIFHFSPAGKLGSITVDLPSDAYSDVIAVTKEKFGPPKSVKRSPVQNRMGATFMDETVTWKRGGEIIMVMKYSSGLSNMIFILSTEQYLAAEEKRIKEREKTRALDL